ncbi:MAG: RNA 2',3'-cyclic phosphodiesterase [candidate division KSB1 bacterium]|nr:RNA 2',3'-cyclic phosphodiesterase [candidate division KSB1 bacterium]
MGEIRTFIAVDVPAQCKQRIADLQKELRAYPGRVTWTRAEGIHVTLKFLGNVEATRIDAVAEALARAVRGAQRPRLCARGTGAFPSWRSPRVFWIGVEDEGGNLARIQRAVEEELEGLGFPREGRPFTPHLTLARVKAPGSVAAMVARLREVDFRTEPFEAEEILVMRSDLKPQGAEYTPLRRVPIG